MAGQQRRRDIASRRRRAHDDGEEGESGPETHEVEDDNSSSDGSDLNEEAEDEEADGDGSEEESASRPVNEHVAKTKDSSSKSANGHVDTSRKSGNGDEAVVTQQPITDTDAMMNGLQVASDPDPADEIDFDDMGPHDEEQQQSQKLTATGQRSTELPHERRQREQEEYRRRRDADPTFVPNRGGFFMHDHRRPGPAANGFRPFGRGRGRGRGAFGGVSSPAHQPTAEPTDMQWSHDLHETVTAPQSHPADEYARPSSRSLPYQPKSTPPARTFSKSTHIGNVQIRVYVSEMPEPIIFSEVPVKQHTRLPQHRPPLRRDKPVRISIPFAAPRYIFPAVERSFIFIPRALRPNQQGHSRMGSRGGPVGSYRGYGSRRTSGYASSMYTPSIAMSRRSSFARDFSRDALISPSGSTRSRGPLPAPDAAKPVVKLPPSADQSMYPPPPPPGAMMGPPAPPPLMTDPHVPVVALPPKQAYPLPQHPTYRENRSGHLPMHQPRPQKAVSVADIEAPDRGAYPSAAGPPPQQYQQPFHQQVPVRVNGGLQYPADAQGYPVARPGSQQIHSQSASGGSLPQIAERGGQQYQGTYQQQPQQAYYQPAYGNPYYMPGPDPRAHQPYGSQSMASTAATAPAFVPGAPQQQNPYMTTAPASQGATLAQESNGMVYYYDPTQFYGASGGYPPASYPMGQSGGVVGMGGMMTPSPDGYYYPQGQGPVYYN